MSPEPGPSPAAGAFPGPRATGLILLGVLALGIGLRWQHHTTYLARSPYVRSPVLDARTYHDLGQQVARGHLVGPEFLPHAQVYPLFLGAVYAAYGVRADHLSWVQALLGLGILLLTFLLGRQLHGARVGLLAAALVALYGPLIFHESKHTPAVLVTLLALVAALAFVWAAGRARTVAALVPGAAFGLLGAARPDLLVWPLLLGALALRSLWREPATRPRRLAFALWLTAGLALMLTPFAVRTALSGAPGRILPTSGGVTCFAGNHPRADGGYRTPPGFSGTQEHQADEARARAAEALGVAEPTDGQVDRHFYGLALRYAASDPGGFLVLLGKKLHRFAMAHESRSEYGYSEERATLGTLGLALVPFSLLLVLGLLGLFSMPAGPARSLLGAAVGAHLLTALVFFAAGRYRMSLVPLLAVPAAAALLGLIARLPARRALVTLGVAALGVAALQPNLRDDPARLRAHEWFNQGTALAREGRSEAAADAFAKAHAAWPRDYLTLVELGNAEMAGHRPRPARRWYRQAVALAPRRALAHLNLALAHLALAERARDRGRTDEGTDQLQHALAELDQARALEPRNVEVLLRHGTVLRTLGRLPAAGEALEEADRLAPGRGDVQAELGVVAYLRRDLEGAQAHFRWATFLGGAVPESFRRAVQKELHEGQAGARLRPPAAP